MNYISEENTCKLQKEIISIGKMLNNLMKSLRII